MSLKVTFELATADLDHFKRVMKNARAVARTRGKEEVIAGAGALLTSIEGVEIPEFIRDRLERLRSLIQMVQDEEWNLPEPEGSHVLNSLAYFCEPEDLIPDEVAGLGFLDDAIMVELVVRELKHEIDAYHDFCSFRAARDAGDHDPVDRTEWLAARRQALQSRMRNRRRRDRQRRRGGAGGGGRSPFSLF